MRSLYLFLVAIFFTLSSINAQSVVDINNSADQGDYLAQESVSARLQSFIPSVSGGLSSIEVYTQSLETPAVTFYESFDEPLFKIIIYRMPSAYSTLPPDDIPDWGNFYDNVMAGDTLLVENFSRIDVGTTTFSFASPVSLSAGQKYLFAIEQNVDLLMTYSFNSGNYANGETAGYWDHYNLASSGASDIAFKTYMIPANVPLTQVRSDYANITLTEMNGSSILRCNPVPNATDYEWQFTEIATNTIVCTKNRGTNYTNFFLTSSFPNIRYNKTYSVKVRAKVFGNWGDFGSSSTLTTPSAVWTTTQLRSDFRNITLPSLNNSTQLRCDPVIGAIDYEWEFTDNSTGMVVRTRKRDANYTNFFIKAYFPNIRMANTYSVKVRAFVNGSWGTYGDDYTITTPSAFGRFAFFENDEPELTEEEMEKLSSEENLSLLELVVSPNPSKDWINLDCNYPIAKITILNIAGQIVAEKTESKIDLSEFSNGIYFISIVTNYGCKVVKVIKE